MEEGKSLRGGPEGQWEAVKSKKELRDEGLYKEWKSKKTITDKYLEVINGLRKSIGGREE